MCRETKPPYPVETTTVTGSSTVLPIHLVKEFLYFKLKYWTETWAYKLKENFYNADIQKGQFGCLRNELKSNSVLSLGLFWVVQSHLEDRNPIIMHHLEVQSPCKVKAWTIKGNLQLYWLSCLIPDGHLHCCSHLKFSIELVLQHWYRTLLVKATSISSSVVPVCSAEASGHYAKKLWISDQIWPHITIYFTKVVRHTKKNWMEIVCCPAIILSSVYNIHIVIATCMDVSAFNYTYEHFSLSITSIILGMFWHKFSERCFSICT